MVIQVAAYHGLDGMIVSLDFTVSMGMVRRGEDVGDFKDFAKALKKLEGKAPSVVGY